jgi:hypothetical protein
MGPSFQCSGTMDHERVRMPVRYLTGGTITVDTIEEAITYERLKASRSQVRKKKPRRGSGLARPNGTWEAFLVTLTTMPSRKILALIKGRGMAEITPECYSPAGFGFLRNSQAVLGSQPFRSVCASRIRIYPI